ncbi:UNVERIFIED_CONTAM: hypothetical protein RMT77_014824 [Armadillidium vulgare]
MDIKSEIDIKDEFFESSEDFRSNTQSFDQDSWMEERRGESFYPIIYVKGESEIKEENLDLKEENEEHGERDVDEVSGLDENQTLNEDVNHDKKSKRLKMEPETSRRENKDTEKMDLKNLCCKYCNINLESPDELKAHLKYLCKRKFRCAHCNYECTYESELKIHLLKHSNIKLFQCSECSNVFNRIDHLKSHMQTHSNFKLFKCSECSYECNLKRNLKSHMLTHVNYKLFKCSQCSYGCNRKVHLKTHMLRHAKIKLFKCSDCAYGCNRKGDFRKHLQRHKNTCNKMTKRKTL